MEIEKVLTLISKSIKANFTLNDRPITYHEVFSDTGLLPALSKRADQLASLCLGYGIGISFEEVETSLLGNKVIFDNVTPNVLRYLFITDVICELVKLSKSADQTPLDELLYD